MRSWIGWAFVLVLVVGTGVAPHVAQLDAAGQRRTVVCLKDAASPAGTLWTYELTESGILGPGRSVELPDRSNNCGNFCQSLVWNAHRKTLHAVGGIGVSTFAVPVSGDPVVIAGSPATFEPANDINQSLTSVRRGRSSFVYTTRLGTSALDAFAASRDGTLTHLDGFPLPVAGVPVAVDSAKDAMFVLEDGSRGIRSYRVRSDGSLTEAPGSPAVVPGTGGLYYVVAHLSGRFVYTGEWNGGSSIHGFAVSKKDAALTPVPGPSLVTDLANVRGGISISKDGLMLAFQTVSGDGTDDVQALRVQKDGSLVKLGEVQSTGLADVNVHAFSPDGRYVVVASSVGDEIKCFAVDRATGELTQTDSRPIPGATNLNGLVVVAR